MGSTLSALLRALGLHPDNTRLLYGWTPPPSSEYFTPPSSPVNHEDTDSVASEYSSPHSFKHGHQVKIQSQDTLSSTRRTSDYITPPSSPMDTYLDRLLTTHIVNELSIPHCQPDSLSPLRSCSPLPSQVLVPAAPSSLFRLPQGAPSAYSRDSPHATKPNEHLRSLLPSLFNDSDESCTRSSMYSTHIRANPEESTAPPVKSAVSAAISPPTLLTTELLAIGEDVLETYQAIREQRPSEVQPEEQPHLVEPKPFSSFSPQRLEKYFAAAVDAKNALQLRKSIVAVDIGDTLEALLPKLTIYEQDELVVETALEDMQLIKEECLHRGLSLNFYALEFLRHILPAHSLSIMERHRQLFSSIEYILEAKTEAQQAAEQFLHDPYSLKERRLPHFWTSQR